MQNLKYPFIGSDTISRHYAQAYQDLFVLSALNGKRNGFFLEIGAGDPMEISNTLLLEEFGWIGISVDIKKTVADKWKTYPRKSRFIFEDALMLDYVQILSSINTGGRIDYLSLDIEPNWQTYLCLTKLPLDVFRFSVITFETDYYDSSPGNRSEEVREKSRELLKSKGYELVNGNVSAFGDNVHPFEDWYLDASVFSADVINKFKRASDESLAASHYMLEMV